MKKDSHLLFTITVYILITCFNLKVQTTVAILSKPYYGVVNGSDLYIATYGDNKISKIDLSLSPAI